MRSGLQPDSGRSWKLELRSFRVNLGLVPILQRDHYERFRG
jgi:hypothetical protein